MSPPPTSVDGTDITRATIDGQEVQEITIDGQTVFIAPSKPDSAISQYKMDEGSGSTLFNEFSGQPDASLNNASFISDSDLVGGFGVDIKFDGNISINSNFGFVDTSSPFSLGVTVVFETQATQQMIWNQSVGSYLFSLHSDANNSDQVTASYFDGSAFAAVESVKVSNPTQRFRVCAAWDPVVDTNKLAIDGVVSSATSANQVGLNNLDGNRFGQNLAAGNEFEGLLDNAIFYDKFLTDSEMADDFLIQPYS